MPENLNDRLQGLTVKTPLSFVADIDVEETLICDRDIEDEMPIIENDVEINACGDQESYISPVAGDQFKVEHTFNYGQTVGGWFWIGELSGESEDPTEAMDLALDKLQSR